MSLRSFPVVLVALVAGVCGCNGGGGGGGGGRAGTPGSPAVIVATPNAVNAQAIIIDGGPFSDGHYVNAPFTSVTVCVPGTSTCQTIDHVLVDTGSFGLRLLAEAVNVPLPTVSTSGGVAAECLIFGDNDTSFGPLVLGDLHIAGELAPSLTIHLIGGFGASATRPVNCPGGDQAADTVNILGAKGILGVGVLRYDCGSQCALPINQGNPGTYYSCANGTCSPIPLPLASQVQNPVLFFSNDNNGVVVELPALPNHASVFVSGSLLFGVGTQSNNALNASVALTTNANSSTTAGEIQTQFPATNGTTYQALIDSGSNAYFFAPPASSNLPPCPTNEAFFCPATTQTFTGQMMGDNSVTTNVTFQIANANQGFATTNEAFEDLGGDSSLLSLPFFDWGLPFYLGRNVFLVIDGQPSTAGPGPYFAF